MRREVCNIQSLPIVVASMLVAVLALTTRQSSQHATAQQFLTDFGPVLLAIATFLAAFIIAHSTSTLAVRSSELRERLNRKIAAEVQVTQFRQTWINSVREDISELISLGFHHNPESLEDDQRLMELSTRIELRLNPSEPSAIKLKDASYEFLIVARKQESAEEIACSSTHLIKLSQDYLKKEWDRLRSDLNRIDAMHEAAQCTD